MFKKLSLGLAVLALTACQDAWDKNPRIEGVPPEVEQGPEVLMAPARDAIFIRAESRYDFVEGESRSIEFQVDVLQEDIDRVEVEIERLEALLPGATYSFDESTGKVTIDWDVPPVFVRGIDNPSAEYLSSVRVTTYSSDPSLGTATRDRPVEFVVKRRLGQPEIVEVKPLEGSLEEGNTGTMEVVVRDPNLSSGRITVGEPVLMVLPSTASHRQSGFNFMTVQNVSQDPSDPSLWKFRVSVRVPEGTIAQGQSLILYYVFQAFTPMGIDNQSLRSAAVEGQFTVTPRLGTVNWTGPVNNTNVGTGTQNTHFEFQVGMLNILSVTFFDPRNRGRVVVTPPPECELHRMDCSCNNTPSTTQGGVAGGVNCRIAWIPQVTSLDLNKTFTTFDLKFKARLERTVGGKSEEGRETTFTQGIIVQTPRPAAASTVPAN